MNLPYIYSFLDCHKTSSSDLIGWLCRDKSVQESKSRKRRDDKKKAGLTFGTKPDEDDDWETVPTRSEKQAITTLKVGRGWGGGGGGVVLYVVCISSNKSPSFNSRLHLCTLTCLFLSPLAGEGEVLVW